MSLGWGGEGGVRGFGWGEPGGMVGTETSCMVARRKHWALRLALWDAGERECGYAQGKVGLKETFRIVGKQQPLVSCLIQVRDLRDVI